MNRKAILAVGLLATVLTAGIVFALTTVTSNHLIGTSTPKVTLTLTGNTSGSVVGDTFILVATLSNSEAGILVTFYDNDVVLGAVMTNGVGVASFPYVENHLAWDIFANATV